MPGKFKCRYCGNTFATRYVLIKHQERTNYCLVKQGKNTEKTYICECGKSYSRNDNLKRHRITCIHVKLPQDIDTMRKDAQNEALQLMLQKYEALIDNLSSRPTTTTNNVTL